MADVPVTQIPPPDAPPAPQAPVGGALLAYALFGVSALVGLLSSGLHVTAPLIGVIGIAGVIVAYVKRDDAAGTWVASHLRWLIRTFWFSVLWGAITWLIGWFVMITLGWLLIGMPIAFLIWAITPIWVIYRVIRGYLLFNDSKPIPGM